jgi:hypothetical protein
VGYAPYSRITTPPSPANAGTAFSVSQDTGPRFPSPPFVALLWEDQTLPDYGVDAEKITVLTIDMDDLTCVRGETPITIRSGLQIALLYSQSRYDLGIPAVITSEEFPVTDTVVELRVRDSQGSVSFYTTDELVPIVGPGGGSAFSKPLTPGVAGQWYYRFESEQRAQPEQDFYVRFSEVF